MTDFLKLIDYYRLRGEHYSDSTPNFSLSNTHKINNSLDALDYEINLNDFYYLLCLIYELPLKIKKLFGAPFWFVKDFDLEFVLPLCNLSSMN